MGFLGRIVSVDRLILVGKPEVCTVDCDETTHSCDLRNAEASPNIWMHVYQFSHHVFGP